MKLIFYFFWITYSCSLLISCQSDKRSSTIKTNVKEDTLQNEPLSSNKALLKPVKKEAFNLIPEGVYQELNTKLAASTKKISAKEVAKMYYPAKIADNTSFEKIDLQTEKKGTQTIVTLTHDNQSEHIRIQGHRIVMTLEQKGTQWQIVSIKQQFKCWIREKKALWSNDKCS